MATTPRTRRKATPDTEAAVPAVTAQVPATKAAAKKASARKTAAPAPAAAAAAAAPAEVAARTTATAAVKPANTTPAKSTPVKTTPAKSAVAKAPAKKAPTAAPATAAVAASAPASTSPAGTTPVKTAAGKATAAKTPTRQAPAATPAAPVAETPVVVPEAVKATPAKTAAAKAPAKKAPPAARVAAPAAVKTTAPKPAAGKSAAGKAAAAKKGAAAPTLAGPVAAEPVAVPAASAPKRPARPARQAATPAAADAAVIVAPAVAATPAARPSGRRVDQRRAAAAPAEATATPPTAAAAPAPAPAAAAAAAADTVGAPRTAAPTGRDGGREPRPPRGRDNREDRGGRGNRRARDEQRPPRAPAPQADRRVDHPADDTAQAVLAVLAAPAPAPAPAPVPTGPAHSAITLVDGDQRLLAWRPGHACPPALRQAAQQRLDAAGHLPPEDDTALPTLLRLAADAGHVLQVDEAVWAHLAAHRDARTRAAVLEAAYPDGPASAALQTLLRAPLPLFQAEGALFAVVAGRALLADERGLGKGVQAIAAATLWRRHFGVRRVLVLCSPAQRAVWQRAWHRFADDLAEAPVQVMEGGLHHRQAQWSLAAGVRILSPEALASDAAHLAQWAPDLVIVDEPQLLGLDDGAWPLLAAPQALVLCGAPLADQPALMQALVAWLDNDRLGPLAALHELQAAVADGTALADDDVERLSAQLSRLMLQRQREDVADQLPPLVHSERLLALAPGQRQAHDVPLAQARRLLDAWRHSGYLSDSDQWRLALALRAMQAANHRADPDDPASALADASVQALLAQRVEWASTGPLRAAVLCSSAADRDQLAQRLAEADVDADGGGHDGGVDLQLLLPGDPLPGGLDAVLQFGVPWKPRRSPAGPRGDTAPGQQWVYLVALDSLDAGLFDTLVQRLDVPRGLGDAAGGGRDYLAGERLADWLRALQAAVLAVPVAPAQR